MLSLEWTAIAAGAPDNPAYQAAADPLALEGGAVLQEFPRSAPNLPPPSTQLDDGIRTWLAARADPGSPVVVMVHGYQYDPSNHLGGGADDPYRLVYGVPGTMTAAGQPLDAHLSWLPLVGECDDTGANPADTAVAFAWLSEGSLGDFSNACWDNDYKYAALDLAPLASRALANVLVALAAHGPTIRILAHSLGTRVVTQAIGLLRGGIAGLDRIVFMGGAEFCVDAAANFAGCAFDVINLASRIDTVLSLGAEQGCHPVRPNGSPAAAVIGREGLGANSRWLDLQLDSDALRTWFATGRAPNGVTYAIDAAAQNTAHPMAAMNHWAYYTNDGNRLLVRDLLLSPGLGVGQFVASNVPAGVARDGYGTFNGEPVPPTPQDCATRRAMVVASAATDGGTLA